MNCTPGRICSYKFDQLHSIDWPETEPQSQSHWRNLQPYVSNPPTHLRQVGSTDLEPKCLHQTQRWARPPTPPLLSSSTRPRLLNSRPHPSCWVRLLTQRGCWKRWSWWSGRWRECGNRWGTLEDDGLVMGFAFCGLVYLDCGMDLDIGMDVLDEFSLHVMPCSCS